MPRAAMLAGAFTLSTAAPAAAQTEGPAAGVASAGVVKKRLHVRAGDRVAVVGVARPAARGHVALQVRVRNRWRTIDRDRTAPSGRYVLRDRRHRAMSASARLKVGAVRRPLGRM